MMSTIACCCFAAASNDTEVSRNEMPNVAECMIIEPPKYLSKVKSSPAN